MQSRALSRTTVFLFVRSHPQLQYYLQVQDTSRAANDRGKSAPESPGSTAALASHNVTRIHPRGGVL